MRKRPSTSANGRGIPQTTWRVEVLDDFCDVLGGNRRGVIAVQDENTDTITLYLDRSAALDVVAQTMGRSAHGAGDPELQGRAALSGRVTTRLRHQRS